MSEGLNPTPTNRAPSDGLQTVASRQIEITNPLGLHMRPANVFVRLAHTFRSDVRVLHNGHSINGKSILDLTSLAALQGTRLVIEARGDDAEAAVSALVELVETKFHELDQESGEFNP
jgi:phosphocarrier protein